MIAGIVILRSSSATARKSSPKPKIFTDQPWARRVLVGGGFGPDAALARELSSAHFDRVYSSDLRRAMSTAAPMAEARGLRVLATQRLREKDDGAWQGHTHSEVQVKYADDYPNYLSRKPDFAAPEGDLRSIEVAGLQAGMPMPPLALQDEVSLSLSMHVAEQTKKDLAAEGKSVPEHPGFGASKARWAPSGDQTRS